MSTSAALRTLIGPVGPQGAPGSYVPDSVSGSTGSLAAGGTVSINALIPRIATILNISSDFAAWIRLYNSEAARTADASRLITQDPAPGSGVVCEVLTSSPSNLNIDLSPTAVFHNSDPVISDVAYLAVTNYEEVTENISVTIGFLQMTGN